MYKPKGYPGADTMDVSELVTYLRNQKLRYRLGLSNDFDDGRLKDGSVDPAGPKISVTAFVNEYYYETDPRDGSYHKDLWKQFVNQPMREMHILSDTKRSADGESREIGASFTIQQLSIQTIYNTKNEDLHSAWGSEHKDDPLESGHDGGGNIYSPTNSGERRGNDSMTNGRYNSLIEWGLITKNGGSSLGTARWDTYLNLTANNDTPLMTSSYNYLRYSCMSRNRDNNGNGKIDLDEVRWYMGATNQLYGLYLGSYGIEDDARLYQRTAVERASSEPTVWRQHLLTSTRYSLDNPTSDNGPKVIWAEEGVSGSIPKNSNIQKYSTRCVRNLGYDSKSTASTEPGKDFSFSPYTHEPDNYIITKKKKKELNGATFVDYDGAWTTDTYYEFDCSRLNEKSLRYYSSVELDSTDEFAEAACLPTHLRMAAKIDAPLISPAQKVQEVNNFLNQNIGQNPFCPPGFRLPNIRELVLIRYFLQEDETSVVYKIFRGPSNETIYAMSRTYWSFGCLGSNKSGKGNEWGLGVNYQKILMCTTNSHATTYERCVKDINVNDPDDIY